MSRVAFRHAGVAVRVGGLPTPSQTPPVLVKPTELTQPSLAGFDVATAARLIAVSADVALIVDPQGVIEDVSIGNSDFKLEGHLDWVGRPWSDTVTDDSRAKVLSDRKSTRLNSSHLRLSRMPSSA